MTAADYSWGTWPPSDIERTLRADLDAALAKLAAVTALITHARARDGLVTACSLEDALGLPRGRRIGEAS